MEFNFQLSTEEKKNLFFLLLKTPLPFDIILFIENDYFVENQRFPIWQEGFDYEEIYDILWRFSFLFLGIVRKN